MKNKLCLYLTLLFFIFIIKIAFAQNAVFKAEIKATHLTKTAHEISKTNILFIKEKNTNDEAIYNEFNMAKKSFLEDYKEKEKLLSDSSDIKQAYFHSLNMFKCSLYHSSEFDKLKEKALLSLIQGKWIGNIDTNYTKNSDVKLTSKLDGSFESDSSGLISKGSLKGYRSIYIKSNKYKAKYPIEASLNGYIIPLTNNIIELKIYDNNINKINCINANNIKIHTNDIINIPSYVDQIKISKSLSFAKSNFKIYYNLLFNSSENVNKLMNYKYNYFFYDLLNLIDLANNKCVSKDLLKTLDLMIKSKSLSDGFIGFLDIRFSYYNEYLYNTSNNINKIKAYKSYLNELMDLTGILYTGIIDDNILKEVNLDLENPNNKINSIYINYYRFLLKLTKHYSNDTKNINEKELVETELNNLKELAKTGIISNNTLSILKNKK